MFAQLAIVNTKQKKRNKKIHRGRLTLECLLNPIPLIILASLLTQQSAALRESVCVCVCVCVWEREIM